MNGRLADLTVNPDGSQNLTLHLEADFSESYDALKDCDLEIEIKKASRHRSLDANNYLWSLCSKIGKTILPPISKEDVYREAIRAVGVYQPLHMDEEAIAFFSGRWQEAGTGWFVDIVDDVKDEPGRKLVHAYYGSSTYTSKEMSVLIDYVVQLAEEQGIPTMTEKEQDKILQLWNRKKKEVVA